MVINAGGAEQIQMVLNDRVATVISKLFDDESFVEFDRFFSENGAHSGVITGHGLVFGSGAYFFMQDSGINKGAMNTAQCRKMERIYEMAAQNGEPVLSFFDSFGVNLDEGNKILNEISAVLYKSNVISGVVPQIAVIVGSCVGSSAVIASNADVVISLESSNYYLNANDETEKSDICVENLDDAIDKIKKLLDIFPANNLESSPIFDFSGGYEKPCEITSDIVGVVADDGIFTEIGNGLNKTAFARIGGIPTGIVLLNEMQIDDKSAAKVARFVRLCDAFSLPVITFVDSESFADISSMSIVSHAYAEATTVKISVVCGKAYGTVFIAVAGKNSGADMVYAWENTTILPLSPDTMIHIYEKEKLKNLENPTLDRKALAEEYKKMHGNVLLAAGDGLVSDVIKPEKTKEYVVRALEILESKRTHRLPKKHSNIRF